MDFCWNENDNALYEQIFAFAHEHLSHKELHDKPERDVWRLCGKWGLPGLCIPQVYGGLGLNALSTAHALEAFGRGCEDMGLVFALSAHLLACTMPIAEFASKEMKERLLPRLCSGEWIGANAITEHDAGSDVFALKALAEQDGAVYRLTGQKSYVTNGPLADIFIVYASTNPKHGYMGITAFVLEKCTAGIQVSEPFHKMGLATAQASSLKLKQCSLSESDILGAKGQGASIFKRSMQWERACLFAAYVGMMERQLEKTIAYARDRRQFGKALSHNQAISHRIADMKLRLESARLLLYRACWLFDQGKEATLEISLAKVAISEATIQSSLDALHIHGAAGYAVETGFEEMLRDSIPSTIFSGTSEIQRDLIARELGL